MKYLSALVLVLFFSLCNASEQRDLELESGTTLTLSHFRGAGETLLLWLPSERGFGPGHVPVARNLSSLGLDVWITRLHESYMIPTGRYSLKDVVVDDLVELIDIAKGEGYREVFIISASRGVELALKLSYRWQQIAHNSNFINGLLVFYPHLIRGRTEIGDKARYIDVASYSNLPVYMIQPQYSTKYARSREIADELQKGGSPVYIHVLPGVQGGFHMRPDVALTAKDLEARSSLANTLQQAVKLLRHSKAAPFYERQDLQLATYNRDETDLKSPGLHRFEGTDKRPAALMLQDLQGKEFDLSRSRGQVVLVNFWATWCGPCVREIPSLVRLVDKMKHKPFKVVAVNIGEPAQVVNEFIKSIPVNFDILLDSQGQTVRDWNVYAYPSNFLLDSNGLIQYAYRGALSWDDASVVDTIEELISD